MRRTSLRTLGLLTLASLLACGDDDGVIKDGWPIETAGPRDGQVAARGDGGDAGRSDGGLDAGAPTLPGANAADGATAVVVDASAPSAPASDAEAASVQPDAGTPGTEPTPTIVDAGATPVSDSGATTVDAGAGELDAGARVDAGEVVEDAGVLEDAAAVVEDAGQVVDAGPAVETRFCGKIRCDCMAYSKRAGKWIHLSGAVQVLPERSGIPDFEIYEGSRPDLSVQKANFTERECGSWYITPNSALADFTVRYVTSSGAADFEVRTDYFSEIGLKKNDR